MKNQICVIANGPSSLNQNLGHIIDQFEEVGRINNYVTTDFEDKIGQKTTLWLNGGNQKLKARQRNQSTTIVFIPYEILSHHKEKAVRRTTKRLKLPANQYTLINEDTMLRYETTCGITRPTTGLNSILWAMDNYKEVIIHGFDCFTDGEKQHYYDSFWMKKFNNFSWVKKAHDHDTKGEKQFIQNLVKEKKVILLTEYAQRVEIASSQST